MSDLLKAVYSRKDHECAALALHFDRRQPLVNAIVRRRLHLSPKPLGKMLIFLTLLAPKVELQRSQYVTSDG
jgi:hypothetical protein